MVVVVVADLMELSFCFVKVDPGNLEVGRPRTASVLLMSSLLDNSGHTQAFLLHPLVTSNDHSDQIVVGSEVYIAVALMEIVVVVSLGYPFVKSWT